VVGEKQLRWTWLGVAAALLAACSDEPAESPQPDSFALLDSAGIVIVLNHADTSALPVWRLDSAAVLRIGNPEGDPAEEFASIVDAVVLSDGSIAVAENRAMQIRFFAADGRHIRTVGNRGSGPGEYRQIYSIHRFAGDSLVVLDTFQSRATVLAPDGQTARVVPLLPPTGTFPDGTPAPIPGIRPAMPAEGGGWITVAEPPNVLPPGLRPPVLAAMPIVVIRYNDAGSIADTLLVTRGVETLFTPAVGPQGEAGYQVMRPGVTLQTYIALRGDGFFVGESTQFVVNLHDGDGGIIRSIRYPRLDRPYEDEEFQRRRERAMASARNDQHRAALEIMLDPVYKPAMRPSFTDLEVDESGKLWVREWSDVPDEPARWLVFDADGRAIAVAEIPRAVLEVGSQRVVVLERDELDVQSVGVYPFVRPSVR